jgi:hypothetical protein
MRIVLDGVEFEEEERFVSEISKDNESRWKLDEGTRAPLLQVGSEEGIHGFQKRQGYHL